MSEGIDALPMSFEFPTDTRRRINQEEPGTFESRGGQRLTVTDGGQQNFDDIR